MRKTRLRHVTPLCSELYYLNNRYIGFVSLLQASGQDNLVLSLIRITHNSQRQGYGPILMKAAIKAHGNKTIRLDAYPHWDCELPILVLFFKRFGFETTAYVHNHYKGPADYAMMIRKPT